MKTVSAAPRPEDAGARRLDEEEEEEEESTESLLCRVLSALHKLGEQVEASNKVCLLFTGF